MDLLEGVTARTVDTDRLRLHVYESGPADGVPVLLVHGNLSTGRFYEHVMSGAPDRYRLIAPDMRGFGRSERVPIDATRGLADWADDLHALLRALRVERPVHLAGWSTGGAAVATYAGRARNPVLLDRSTWPDVSAAAVGDEGARGWLRAHPELVVQVDCTDVGSPDDLDTPADLAALREAPA